MGGLLRGILSEEDWTLWKRIVAEQTQLRVLVLAGSAIRSDARWGQLPPGCQTRVHHDPYAVAVCLMQEPWDALLVDPVFLSGPAMTLVAGAIRHRNASVWMLESGGNAAL